MLNIVTASTIGDYLSVLIDSGLFFLKQYTQFRFQMVREFSLCNPSISPAG